MWDKCPPDIWPRGHLPENCYRGHLSPGLNPNVTLNIINHPTLITITLTMLTLTLAVYPNANPKTLAVTGGQMSAMVVFCGDVRRANVLRGKCPDTL